MPGSRTELLRNRRFRTLMVARTLSMLALSFAPVALAFGVLDLPGAGPSTLSLVLAASAIAMVIFTLGGGIIADRYPRDRILQSAEWVSGAVHIAIGTMLLTGHAPLWGLMTATFIAGMGGALVWPALTGIVPDIVPPGFFQDGNALLGLGGNLARVGGLVAGGVVVVHIGGGWALIVAGATFLLSGYLISTLRLPHVQRDRVSESVLADIRGGWQEFRSRQWLWVTVTQFSFLVMAWQAAHLVLGPVVAKQDLGGAGGWTTVLTTETIGFILGGLLSMRVRPRRPILVVILFSLGASPPYLLLGWGAPLVVVAVAAFVLGVSFEIFTVLWQTTLQRHIPPESLARVSSFDALGSLLLGPIGVLLAGPAAEIFGARHALLGCGIAMLVITLTALSLPSIRSLHEAEPQAPEPRPDDPREAGPAIIVP